MLRIALASVALSVAAPTQTTSADQLLANARQQVFNDGARTALPGLERALSLYRQARNTHGEAVALGYIGYCYKELGEFPKALEYLHQSLRMKQRLGDHQEEAKTLINLGLVYWKTGNYAEAIRVSSQALSIGRQLHHLQIEGAALGNLGLVYHEQGDYRQSIEYYKHALAIHRQSGFVRGESDTLGNIGGLNLDLGRYREAIPYYQQALALDEREKLKPDESLDLGNLALCQAGIGEFAQSLAAYDRALALARETGNKADEADWHKGKGSVLLKTGKYDRALAEYRLAAEVYEQAGLQRELTELLQDLGGLHVSLGDLGSADTEYRRALEIAQRIRTPRNVTGTLIALGDLEWRRRRYSQAAELYREAVSRARQSGNREQIAAGLVQLALLDRDQGRADQARKDAREALRIARENGLRPLEAQALYAAGEAERTDGQFAKALEHYASGKAIAQAMEDSDLGWRFGYARGQALETLQRPEEAVRAYQNAVILIESVRSVLREDRFRAGYLQDKYQVYVALVRLLLQLGRIKEAFGYSEKMRRQSLSALLIRSTPGTSTPAEQELRERIRRLQRELDGENAKPASERHGSTGQLSSELASAERSYQNLIDDSRAANSGDAPGRAPAVPRLETLQGRLAADTALIEYIVTDDNVGIFVLTAGALHALSVPVRAPDLGAKVELLRALLPRGAGWQKPAESLRRSLLDPLERAGWLDKITKLYIVPHGMLHYLPFAMLPRTNANRYLIEDYAISYLASAVALLRPSAPSTQPNLFAEAPARSNLPYAQEEARSIGAFYPNQSRVLVGASATESSFKREATHYRIIHLATHGYFNRLNPLFSAVELEPDQAEDGRLEVHEILNLRLRASLVTLSACDTALGSGYFGEIPAGDEFVGLTQAFLYAGSPAVLATLWEVNDRSTLDLMRGFYNELPNSGNAEALARVQRAMLRRGGRTANPYFWSAFVLVGQMR